MESQANGDADLYPVPKLRVAQIIAGALIGGLSTFFLIVLFIVSATGKPQVAQNNPQIPIISFVAIAIFVVNLVLFLVLPASITGQGLKAIISGKWQQLSHNNPRPPTTITEYLQALHQTTLIVALALLEGAGFFACTAYMLERQWYTACLAIVLILIMAINFPTASRARNWMIRSADQLEELRNS
jgi:hypothetical protein